MTRLFRFGIMMAIGASVCSAAAPQSNPWQIAYADQPWYRERPEGEREWHGVLQPRKVTEGPNARTALRYELVMNGDAIAVYAPTYAVDAFANNAVSIRGKQIDLRNSNGGMELWPGAIMLRGRTSP